MNELIIVLIVTLAMVAIGLVVYFIGNLSYDTIDRPLVTTLADSGCPQCGTIVGREAAEAAEDEVAREDAGIRMIVGGYVPSAFNPYWKVQCPHCHALLTFDAAARLLRKRADRPSCGPDA